MRVALSEKIKATSILALEDQQSLIIDRFNIEITPYVFYDTPDGGLIGVC